jgi:hypothetical protein
MSFGSSINSMRSEEVAIVDFVNNNQYFSRMSRNEIEEHMINAKEMNLSMDEYARRYELTNGACGGKIIFGMECYEILDRPINGGKNYKTVTISNNWFVLDLKKIGIIGGIKYSEGLTINFDIPQTLTLRVLFDLLLLLEYPFGDHIYYEGLTFDGDKINLNMSS